MLHEGDVIATIELVDEISVAASTTFSIHVLADPWDGTQWFEEDDLSEYKETLVRAQSLADKYDELNDVVQRILLMFDIKEFVDENHDGIPDDEQDVPSIEDQNGVPVEE